MARCAAFLSQSADQLADNKRLDPIHATLEAIAAHLQRIEQNSNFSYANTSASSKTGSPAGTASEGSLSAPTTLPGIRNDPEKTKFWGTSHYRHFFDQVCLRTLALLLLFYSYMLQRFSLFGRLKSKDAGQYARDNAHTNSIVQLVERCRDLRRQIKESRRSTAIDPFPNIFATMPSEDVCQRLVNVYVRSVEPLYRILHIPTFWAQLDRHWRNMDAAPVCFRMKVLLVMAIGSAFTPCEGSSDNVRSNIPHWILAAQWWLAGPSERMTYNMDGLQIRCLLLLACYVNSVGTKASRWIAAGALRRSACSLGLHRDPAHFPNVPPFLAEMRKRLWATVLELDLQAAFDANMPYDVSRDAFDCGPPSDISDDELHEADTSLLSTHKRRQPSQTALQLLLLRYLPLRVSVVRYINAIAEDSSYEEALRLGSELRGFRREIQVFLEAQRQRSKHALNPYDAFQARYLDSMVLRYTLFLNRPFAIKAMHDPRFYYSRKECCDASIALLIPIADGDLYSDGKGRLPPVSIASAAGAVSFDAITYLCLELTKQLEEQGPQLPGSHTYIKDVCQDSRDQILSLLQRLRDRLLESISEGDTSLKKFIFLASALSQIEATAAGRPAERVLTETLRNSLEQCQALLRQHLPADMGLAEPDFSDMFRMNGPLPDFGALDDIEKWLQSPSEEMDNFASTMSGF